MLDRQFMKAERILRIIARCVLCIQALAQKLAIRLADR